MYYRHNFLVVCYNNKKESNTKTDKNHYHNTILSAHRRTRIKGLKRRTKFYYNNGTCRISIKIFIHANFQINIKICSFCFALNKKKTN